MNFFQIILLFFLTVPLVEIYLLIRVGSLIGAFPTILLVVVTAIVGAWLLRQQGLSTWHRFRQNMVGGQMPAMELIEGPLLLIGGVLLLTPGLLTDVLGFACLIPQSRRCIARYFIRHGAVVVASRTQRSYQAGAAEPQSPAARQGDVIEGEYQVEKDNNHRKNR